MKKHILCGVFMILITCPAFAYVDKYDGDMNEPWWGFLVVIVFAAIGSLLNVIRERKIKNVLETIDPSKSLEEACPEIAKLWNYKHNGHKRPHNVKPDSNETVHWICPLCNRDHLKAIREKVAFPECPFCKK